MTRRVVTAVATLLIAWLGLLAPAAGALATPDRVELTNTHASRHHPWRALDDISERGPRAPYDRTVTSHGTVDRWSYGVSVRPDGLTRPTVASDDTRGFVSTARSSWITEERAGRATRAPFVVERLRVAANTGPRALPTGPWGQKIVERSYKTPQLLGPGTPNAKGVGTRWFDPANKGNGIRIDQGLPGSSFASQQVDHVVVRSGGRILGPDGKPIVGSLSQNPQAHIPLSDWLTWSSWSTP